VHVGVRSQTRPHHNRDGAWLVGCCHLFSDLQGSGDYPQSPEQGEWMSLLQTLPITTGLRVIKVSSASQFQDDATLVVVAVN
jgi:hypothetical protein